MALAAGKKIPPRPESKTDNADIETELKQLQRAINSLKPKEEDTEEFQVDIKYYIIDYC